MKTLREAANQRARLFSMARIEVKVGYMLPGPRVPKNKSWKHEMREVLPAMFSKFSEKLNTFIKFKRTILELLWFQMTLRSQKFGNGSTHVFQSVYNPKAK
ncbi:hypothetical protein AVEN_121686-1 [Araneus ventricosus]|uniref:Uncharacterized protein n=1 Tax=Araneus ventricosus TaxID=182803 RepID=A0A4Y2MJ24_ARAVE|nr:hypothetical protein AVEN_121686-1 [Araneus ventricosus]